MKCLLKQNKEDKGILCDKVTIDGFDYYVSDMNSKRGWFYCYRTKSLFKDEGVDINCCNADVKVITTNNQSLDIPKVVDDVEDLDILKSKWYDNQEEDRSEAFVFQYSGIVDDALEKGIILGYNKSQETHPYTASDMIEFAKWSNRKEDKSKKDLLQLWKEQRPKIVYYNE